MIKEGEAKKEKDKEKPKQITQLIPIETSRQAELCIIGDITLQSASVSVKDLVTLAENLIVKKKINEYLTGHKEKIKAQRLGIG